MRPNVRKSRKLIIMKKIIILFLLIVSGVMSSYAKTSYEYVGLGNGLELIIKTETHWFGDDTFTYGLRRNGMTIIKPVYEQNSEALIVDELSFLIFMSRDMTGARIFDITTGKEVYTRKYEGFDPVTGYSFKSQNVNGHTEWQLIETTINNIYPVYTVIARFALKNGKVCQL